MTYYSKTPKQNLGFLQKTYEIFMSPVYSPYCGWDNAGRTIIIHDVDDFCAHVLPIYFKHRNIQSFVRQLNMYDFHKTSDNPNDQCFHHPNFRRGHPELLDLIKRKVNVKATKLAQAELAAKNNGDLLYNGRLGNGGTSSRSGAKRRSDRIEKDALAMIKNSNNVNATNNINDGGMPGQMKMKQGVNDSTVTNSTTNVSSLVTTADDSKKTSKSKQQKTSSSSSSVASTSNNATKNSNTGNLNNRKYPTVSNTSRSGDGNPSSYGHLPTTYNNNGNHGSGRSKGSNNRYQYYNGGGVINQQGLPPRPSYFNVYDQPAQLIPSLMAVNEEYRLHFICENLRSMRHELDFHRMRNEQMATLLYHVSDIVDSFDPNIPLNSMKSKSALNNVLHDWKYKQENQIPPYVFDTSHELDKRKGDNSRTISSISAGVGKGGGRVDTDMKLDRTDDAEDAAQSLTRLNSLDADVSDLNSLNEISHKQSSGNDAYMNFMSSTMRPGSGTPHSLSTLANMPSTNSINGSYHDNKSREAFNFGRTDTSNSYTSLLNGRLMSFGSFGGGAVTRDGQKHSFDGYGAEDNWGRNAAAAAAATTTTTTTTSFGGNYGNNNSNFPAGVTMNENNLVVARERSNSLAASQGSLSLSLPNSLPNSAMPTPMSVNEMDVTSNSGSNSGGNNIKSMDITSASSLAIKDETDGKNEENISDVHSSSSSEVPPAPTITEQQTHQVMLDRIRGRSAQ